MTVPTGITRAALAVAATTVLAAGPTAGCGADTAPADAAPVLVERLADVDRAVAGGDATRIRKQVASLVAATESARDSGRLDRAQADRILTAASALLSRLPEPTPTAPPTSSPTTSSPAPSPTTASPEGGDEGDEDEEGDGDEDEEGSDEEGSDDGHGRDDKGKPKGKGKGHRR